MLEALWIWSRYPRQIASDLSQFHHRRIADWHRGRRDEYGDLVLSSYELLELLEFMPEEGAFKKAARGGRQTRAERVAEEHYNETARIRLSYHIVNGGPKYEPIYCIDPVDELEQARLEAEDEQYQAQAVATFESEIGFS